MPRAYSEDLRWRVVWPQVDGVGIGEVSRRLRVSTKTAKRLYSRFKTHGDVAVSDFGLCGRPPALDGQKQDVSSVFKLWPLA